MGEYTDYSNTKRYKAAQALAATLKIESREWTPVELFDYLYEQQYDWNEASEQWQHAQKQVSR